MPAAHKGAISFGLVHIPVALHTARSFFRRFFPVNRKSKYVFIHKI